MMQAQNHQEELDVGPRSGGSNVERFCAVTREAKPIDQLIRFVIGPDGLVPDLKRKLPGRGMWITGNKPTLADAVSKNVFARGFKRDIQPTAELINLTERLLLQAILDALSIAGKSGAILTGFTKVEAAIAEQPIECLFHASDAGRDGIAKLDRTLQRQSFAGRIKVINSFSIHQLSLALGRSNVVHAALIGGPASNTFLARFTRLERFLTGYPGDLSGDRSRNAQDLKLNG